MPTCARDVLCDHRAKRMEIEIAMLKKIKARMRKFLGREPAAESAPKAGPEGLQMIEGGREDLARAVLTGLFTDIGSERTQQHIVELEKLQSSKPNRYTTSLRRVK